METRTYGGLGTEGIRGIKVDAQGNIYTLAKFEQTVNLGPGGTEPSLTADASAALNHFLLKTSPDGNLLWAHRLAGDYWHRLALMPDGTAFITGAFSGFTNFQADWDGDDTKMAQKDSDVFVTRIEADGGYGWTHVMGGTGRDYPAGITVTPDGTVYLAATYAFTINFQLDWGGTETFASLSSYSECYTTALNGDGSYLWTKPMAVATDSPPFSECKAVESDTQGNVLVLGEFRWTCDFRKGIDGTPYERASQGPLNDIFLTRFTPASTYQWTRIFPVLTNADGLYARAVRCDGTGATYLVGTFSGTINFRADWSGTADTRTAQDCDAFITKVNQDGSYGWTHQFGGMSTDEALGLDIQKDMDLVMIVGYYSSNMDFAADWGFHDYKAVVGARQTFITVLDTNGGYRKTKVFGENPNTYLFFVQTLPDGTLYAAGDYDGQTNFQLDWPPGVDQHTPVGGTDVWMVKLRVNP